MDSQRQLHCIMFVSRIDSNSNPAVVQLKLHSFDTFLLFRDLIMGMVGVHSLELKF